MISVATPHKGTVILTGIFSRITTAFQALTARASIRLFDRAERQWYSLDERLLRDIGASPFEAENARLHARWAVPEAAETDAVANQGLSANAFMRDMKRPIGSRPRNS
ncbi:hypothetical protein [Methylovirgula sp. 4M-Z18]|uniref:hypothetical protein n=1 Tax=Methylovirgula sp. 4M-Z18 TaxID=2293567 RepID=UPI000E2EA5E9|nr:hypothetical protein [Methylovirgula sp. 4M-Z18]RFB79701.1 hypothetical protein DYH55_09485 [Methylovirgula sp. 4M-Z18]